MSDSALTQTSTLVGVEDLEGEDHEFHFFKVLDIGMNILLAFMVTFLTLLMKAFGL